jgi:hypothetical protein
MVHWSLTSLSRRSGGAKQVTVSPPANQNSKEEGPGLYQNFSAGLATLPHCVGETKAIY